MSEPTLTQPRQKNETNGGTPATASGGSRISNFEWGMLIGVAVATDLAQIVLDIFVIGAVINRLIDLFFGMTLSFYLWMKGVKMDAKKVLAIVGAFAGEMIPIVDALPLWSADVLLLMSYEKVGKKVIGAISGTPIQTAITKANKK